MCMCVPRSRLHHPFPLQHVAEKSSDTSRSGRRLSGGCWRRDTLPPWFPCSGSWLWLHRIFFIVLLGFQGVSVSCNRGRSQGSGCGSSRWGGTGLVAHRGGERDGEGAEPGDSWKCPETRLFVHTHSAPHCASLLAWVRPGGTVAVGAYFTHTVVWL